MQETKELLQYDFYTIRKKERKKYNNTLKLNKVIENKIFWKTIKYFSSDKGTNINKIRHVNRDKGISDDKQMCKTLSNFLQEVMKTPGVSESFYTFNYSHRDLVNNAIRKSENNSGV